MDQLLCMHLSLILPLLTPFHPPLYLFRDPMPHYVPNVAHDLDMAAYLQPVNNFHGKCQRAMRPRSQTTWIGWTGIIGQPCVHLLNKLQEVLLCKAISQVRTIIADRVHRKSDQCLQYRNPFDRSRQLLQLPTAVDLSRCPYLQINILLQGFRHRHRRRHHHHSHLVEPPLPSTMIVV
jgi:hypothetical protein